MKTKINLSKLFIIVTLATGIFSTAFALERIAIEGSPKTPTIIGDQDSGILVIKGRSIPENSIEFYQTELKLEGRSIPENSFADDVKLDLFLESYANAPAPTTTVVFQLTKNNDKKSPALTSIFKKLESIHKGGSSKISINWYYEQDDEDMLRAGEDYQAIINIPFIFSKVP